MELVFRTVFLFAVLVQDSLVKSALFNRIVNGKSASAGEFPYQLSLRRNGRHICGASVLNNKWAISAAHCVEGNHRIYSIRAGTHKRTSGGMVMNVQEILVHPLYDGDTMNFDVALLRTQSTLRGEFIEPIRLPRVRQPIPMNAGALVSGWGHLSSMDDTLPEELKYIEVYTMDQDDCAQKLQSHGTVTNAMFCASERLVDACQGDSGGPINMNGVLIGVVSWGIGCADPDYPGVYSRIAYPPIRRWIKVVTNM